MIEFLEFSVLVIIVSASGVMAPGPLFAANLVYGLKQGTKSGIKMAIGHTIVELPLVVLLGIGVFSLESFPEFRTIISIFGAITLFVFAAIQIKSLFRKNELTHFNPKQGPINHRDSTKCIKSIFYYLVVNNRIQIDFRCHDDLGICRNTDCICSTYLDGFCLARSNFFSCIKN